VGTGSLNLVDPSRAFGRPIDSRSYSPSCGNPADRRRRSSSLRLSRTPTQSTTSRPQVLGLRHPYDTAAICRADRAARPAERSVGARLAPLLRVVWPTTCRRQLSATARSRLGNAANGNFEHAWPAARGTNGKPSHDGLWPRVRDDGIAGPSNDALLQPHPERRDGRALRLESPRLPGAHAPGPHRGRRSVRPRIGRASRSRALPTPGPIPSVTPERLSRSGLDCVAAVTGEDCSPTIWAVLPAVGPVPTALRVSKTPMAVAADGYRNDV